MTEYYKVLILLRHIWAGLSPSTQHSVAHARLLDELQRFQPSR